MIRIRTCAAVLLGLTASTAAFAQTTGTVRFPGTFRTWTLEDQESGDQTTISQVHIPLVSTLHLAERADLVLSSSGASSTLERDGAADRDLSGLSDVTAQVFYRFPGDRILLQAGANLPSGKTGLDEDELAVARVLSQPILGFSLKQYGQGFDATGGIALALPAGPGAVIGLGAGIVAPGSYTLIDGGGDFAPGTQISLTAGLDLTNTETGAQARLDSGYRIYSTDELDGEPIFEEGNQIELQATGRAPAAGLILTAASQGVFKADNAILQGPGATVASISQKPGTSFDIRLGADRPLGERWLLGVRGEWRSFNGSDTPGRDGTAFGAGPSARVDLGASAWFRLNALVMTGSLDAGDGFAEQDLSGVAITAALSWTGGANR